MKRTSLLIAVSILLPLPLIAAAPEEPAAEIHYYRDPLDGLWFFDGGGLRFTFEFGKGILRICNDDRHLSIYHYRLDYTGAHPAIYFSDGTCGIFAVTSDSLRLCITREKGWSLPTDFTSGLRTVSYVVKRMR